MYIYLLIYLLTTVCMREYQPKFTVTIRRSHQSHTYTSLQQPTYFFYTNKITSENRPRRHVTDSSC